VTNLGLRRIAARMELDRLAFPGQPELRRSSDGVLLRISERGEEHPRGIAEDPQIEREGLFERLDRPAPDVPTGGSEHERRGERLTGSAGVAGVPGRTRRLEPKAGDPAAALFESAAEAAEVAGKSEADRLAVPREARLGVAECRPPLRAVARQRELAAQGGAEHDLGDPQADERILSRRRPRRGLRERD